MKTIGELIDAGVISRETKVVGELPLTADGCVIGHKAWLWTTFPGVKGRDDDKPMRCCYKPCPIVEPDSYTDGPSKMYSTREAALAAKEPPAMTKILNAFNPCGTDMNPAADPRLAAFYNERHPGHDNRVVWLSREDCSVKERLGVKLDEAHAFNPKASEIMRRAACDALLASFCPVKTVRKLVERGLPRDFDGYIGFDHEIPAWMSCLHFSVYHGLRNAIKAEFPLAECLEYAGLRTDFVISASMPERSHELRVMDRLCGGTKHWYIPHLYVPGVEYLRGLNGFRKNVEGNIKRWRSANATFPAIAVNPFIEGTQKDPGDYTSGSLVPVEAMTVIVKAINSIGAKVAIWGAAYNERQGARFVDAVEQVMIPAVEAAEAKETK